MFSVFNTLKNLIISRKDHYLSVDFEFYKRWKLIIKILVFFNPQYLSCTIFRKKYKFQKNLVIVGLRTNGRIIKRRTNGLAKQYLLENSDSICVYCEKLLTNDNITSDHIVPISEGGNNSKVNLIFCCAKCNGERGNMDFKKYLRNKNPKYKDIKYPFV